MAANRSNCGWTSDKIREEYEGFFYWITKSCEELKIPLDSDDDSCWCYMKTRKKFKVISQVRNMLLNIPSNEASCERSLSYIKKVVNLQSIRTGDLEMAKLTYINRKKSRFNFLKVFFLRKNNRADLLRKKFENWIIFYLNYYIKKISQINYVALLKSSVQSVICEDLTN